jgi:two-component system cell cycle sensor histidine kinase/response regulator CckA
MSRAVRPSSAGVWARAAGPLATIAVLAVIELLAGSSLRITNPPALFVLAIVLAAFIGGVASGLISAAIGWAYTAYFFSDAGAPFQYVDANLRRVVVWAFVMPLIAVMVGVLNRRVRAAEALEASEKRFRVLLDHANDAIEVIDPQSGRFLDVNDKACRAHGYTRDEYLSLTIPDIDPLMTPEHLKDSMDEVRRSGTDVIESQHRRKDGSVFPVEINKTYIRLDRDYLVAVVRDITERKQVEAALRASESRFRALVEDTVPAAIVVVQGNRIRYINATGERLLGYPPGAMLEMNFWDTVRSDYKDIIRDRGLARLRGEPVPTKYEVPVITRSGEERWLDVSITSTEFEGQPASIGCAFDITERKRAEALLAGQNRILEMIALGAPLDDILTNLMRLIESQGHGMLCSILLLDDDGVHVQGGVAPSLPGAYLTALEGLSIGPRAGSCGTAMYLRKPVIVTDILEDPLWDACRPLAAPHGLRACWSTPIASHDGNVLGSFAIYYREVRSPGDAETRLIEIGTNLAGIAIQRKRGEDALQTSREQLRHAQKLEAVGRLAGGVAHDFNNLLTVINGCSELVVNSLAADDSNRDLLGEVRKAGERAAHLTHQLLAFSRKQVLQPQVVSLNVLLRDLLKLLQRLIGEDLDLTLAPDEALGLAKVDPGQFEQAITNLVVNARDAMPHGGRLTIETHNADLNAEYAERYPDVAAGAYVLVSVRDSGEGMDEATKARIFEPFFTTKQAGKGTGLGLAMVYGFVKQSGGHIEVFSEPDRGTTFKLYLPRAEQDAPSEPLTAVHDVPKGTETILLVEDEDAVRALVNRVLSSNGYTVLQAPDGTDAIAVAEQHRGPIDLLVTDLVMPRMSGRQLAQNLARTRPRMRVLFMSGYSDETVLPDQVIGPDIGFLQKPFTPVGLARKIREVLDADETGEPC